MTSNHIKDYDESYIEACFFVWYKAGAPGLRNSNKAISIGGAHIRKVLPPSPDGRTPNIQTVLDWMDKYDWRSRADALDAEVSRQLEKQAIQDRIKTLQTLAQNGKTLKDKGLDYLNKGDNPFADNPGAAVRAVIAGAEMEFKYAGAADRLAAISQMSDKQIEREILHLLGKESNENEDIVDADSEDIPSTDDNSDESNES